MLRVALTPSPYLAIFFIALHLAAAVILAPLDLALWIKLALAMAIAASLAHVLWRHAFLKSRSALISVELREADRAAVQTREGTWQDARILSTSYVSPLLTVLNLRLRGETLPRHIVIVPDNVDFEDFRKLRVLLRWGDRKVSV